MNSFSEYPYSVEPALSTHPVLSRHHAVPHEWLPNTGSTGSEIPVVIKYNKQIHEHFYGRFNGGPIKSLFRIFFSSTFMRFSWWEARSRNNFVFGSFSEIELDKK